MGDPLDAKHQGDEPTLRESKSALLEAAQAAVEEQKTRGPGRLVAGAGAAQMGFRVLLLLIAVGGGTVLAMQPSWLVGPEPVVEGDAIRSASAQLALVVAVAQVRAYVTTSGHLPGQPAQAGITNGAITLKPLAAGEFELSIRAGNTLIAVRSTDSLKPLVVSAVRALQRRAG